MGLNFKLATVFIMVIDFLGSFTATSIAEAVNENIEKKLDLPLENIKKMFKSSNGFANDNENWHSWTDEKQDIGLGTICIGYSYEFYTICLPKCDVFLRTNSENRTREIEAAHLFKSCRMKFCPSKAVDVYYSCLKNNLKF